MKRSDLNGAMLCAAGIVLFSLLSCPAQGQIGFKLPPGAHSRAYNLIHPGEVMDLSVDPFAPGLTSAQVNEALSRRYGHAVQYPGDINPTTGLPVFQLPDCQGPHVTDYEGALNDIARMNPGWFKANGLGDASHGNGIASLLERSDARFAANISDQVLAEAKRLNLLESPPPPGPVDPPPTGAVCGNNHREPGETCATCPGDVPGCPAPPPPPPPPAPDHCADPAATCHAACPVPPAVKPCKPVAASALADAQKVVAGYKAGPFKQAARRVLAALQDQADYCPAVASTGRSVLTLRDALGVN